MSATPSSNLGFQNFFSALLTGDITASSVDILMDAIPNATEGFLVIDPLSTTAREVIFYNSKTALKVVCPSAADGRGQDDTTAGAHLTGTTVIMAPVAGFWEAFQSGLAFTDGVINTSKLIGASEFIYDHIASGCLWTGDSLGSTRNASMTLGKVYIGGKRVSVAAVTARSFTASKDTYIDVDNTGTLTYTEVANNAASPALAAGSLRIACITTAAGSIAAAGNVNTGNLIVPTTPTVSGRLLQGSDSLGNAIGPRVSHDVAPVAGFIAASENATGAAYSNLPTNGPICAVLVPRSGAVLISFQATQAVSGVFFGNASIDVTGANTISASTMAGNGFLTACSVTNSVSQGFTKLLTGLTPGLTIFRVLYSNSSGAGTASFGNRSLTIVPM